MLVHNSDFGDYDGLWSSIKKGVKKVGTVAARVGTVIVSPLALMPMAAVKGVTWVGSKAGIKPLKAADKKVNAFLTKSPTGKLFVKTNVINLAVGAVVGGGILAAGAISTAAAGATAAGSSGLLAGGAKALDLAKAAKGLVPAKAPSAAQITDAALAQGTVTGALDPGAPGAGSASKSSMIGPLAGAGVGFVAGGPVGAIIGGIIGAVAGRKQS